MKQSVSFSIAYNEIFIMLLAIGEKFGIALNFCSCSRNEFSSFLHEESDKNKTTRFISRGYTSDFLLAMVMRWWLHEWQSLWFCREKFNSFNFSWFLFLCDFFSCRHRSTCARVATHVIFHHRKQKNRSCSHGFMHTSRRRARVQIEIFW